tara:strand:+ start:57 stop:176 length:120 start_codon:yes stop_codon:yes gene_type:complete
VLEVLHKLKAQIQYLAQLLLLVVVEVQQQVEEAVFIPLI